MMVEVISGEFKGTVLLNATELKIYYKGLWSSMAGSYYIKVNKKDCRIMKDENDTEFRKMIESVGNWIRNNPDNEHVIEMKELLSKERW